MKKSSWIVLATIVILGGLLAYQKLSAPLPPDDEQISALLTAGEAAVESRSVRRALSCISRDYSDPTGLNSDALRLQVIEAFRAADAYDVTMQTAEMRIAGDTADVQTLVTVAAVKDGDRHEVFEGQITIKLKKEPAKRYLVFPTKTWRVVGMAGLPLGPLE